MKDEEWKGHITEVVVDITREDVVEWIRDFDLVECICANENICDQIDRLVLLDHCLNHRGDADAVMYEFAKGR